MELMQLLLVVNAAELLHQDATPGERVERTTDGRRFLATVIKTGKQWAGSTLFEYFGYLVATPLPT